MLARATNSLKPTNPIWTTVKQQAVLSQKRINECLGQNVNNGGQDKAQTVLLQGFADDLDDLLAKFNANGSATIPHDEIMAIEAAADTISKAASATQV